MGRTMQADDERVGFVTPPGWTLKAGPPAAPNVGPWPLTIAAKHQRGGIGRELTQQRDAHARRRPNLRILHTACVDEPDGLRPFDLGSGFEPQGEASDGEVDHIDPLQPDDTLHSRREARA